MRDTQVTYRDLAERKLVCSKHLYLRMPSMPSHHALHVSIRRSRPEACVVPAVHGSLCMAACAGQPAWCRLCGESDTHLQARWTRGCFTAAFTPPLLWREPNILELDPMVVQRNPDGFSTAWKWLASPLLYVTVVTCTLAFGIWKEAVRCGERLQNHQWVCRCISGLIAFQK